VCCRCTRLWSRVARAVRPSSLFRGEYAPGHAHAILGNMPFVMAGWTLGFLHSRSDCVHRRRIGARSCEPGATMRRRALPRRQSHRAAWYAPTPCPLQPTRASRLVARRMCCRYAPNRAQAHGHAKAADGVLKYRTSCALVAQRRTCRTPNPALSSKGSSRFSWVARVAGICIICMLICCTLSQLSCPGLPCDTTMDGFWPARYPAEAWISCKESCVFLLFRHVAKEPRQSGR
jgi:hypothetical protein